MESGADIEPTSEQCTDICRACSVS
jgi:hypothetical protein